MGKVFGRAFGMTLGIGCATFFGLIVLAGIMALVVTAIRVLEGG